VRGEGNQQELLAEAPVSVQEDHPLPSEGAEASTLETATEWPLLQVKTTLLACTAMYTWSTRCRAKELKPAL